MALCTLLFVHTLGPISSAGRTAEPFCPAEIRSIPFFSHLYIYGALWGPSVLPAERQNRSAHQKFVPSLFLAIYIYTVHFGAHQFCRQNGRTVLPAERQNRSAHQKFVPSPFLARFGGRTLVA